MKRKYVTYEEFVPDVVEVYDVEKYIVEDDPELQPAVALNQMLKNYGPAKVFSGYSSPDASSDIPVTRKDMDIHDIADAHRATLAEHAANVEAQKQADALKAEPAELFKHTAQPEPVTDKAANPEPTG